MVENWGQLRIIWFTEWDNSEGWREYISIIRIYYLSFIYTSVFKNTMIYYYMKCTICNGRCCNFLIEVLWSEVWAFSCGKAKCNWYFQSGIEIEIYLGADRIYFLWMNRLRAFLSWPSLAFFAFVWAWLLTKLLCFTKA